MTDWPQQRLSAPNPDHYTDQQREIHDAIATGPRGGVRGPLAVWLHRPELASKAQELGRYCRYDSALEPRLSELAILMMARHWRAEYEWLAHKPAGLKAGLSPETVEAIRTGQTPTFASDQEQAIYDVSLSVLETRGVSDDIFERAKAALGQDRLVDLIGVLGYYSLISMTLNVFRISPPDTAGRELI